MRITKKKLKEAKRLIQDRINQLRKMTKDEFAAEIARINTQGGVQFTGTDHELALFLVNDLVDRALPDHWLY